MDNASRSQQISRRAFLRGALFSEAGRERCARQIAPWGPAPPWHGGFIDQAGCVQCGGACMQSCETGVIAVYPENHALAGLPYLNFTDAGCSLCQACREVCPVERLSPPSQPSLSKIRLDTGRCLAWNGTVCMSCLGHCDGRALSRTKTAKIELNLENCTGCGMCVSACPTQALFSPPQA